MHKNILIGITGNIASGKSSVMEYCHNKGYKTFYADDVVHELYEIQEVQEKVREILPELKLVSIAEMVEAFFSKLFTDSGNIAFFRPINRAKLSKIIFADETKRRLLENLIHPMVTKELKGFAKNLGSKQIGFAEVPLLFEAKMEDIFDYTILIHCDRNIRSKRAEERGTGSRQFDKIERAQMSEEKKKHLADFVIDSNAPKEIWISQIDKIIEEINERNNT